ncbi:MAG TPA: response regulator [bacterium]|nr:response regulator [bacterium]HOL46741.1 response regulator [bacterium]HPQ18177.1 response regulator [bacterium]
MGKKILIIDDMKVMRNVLKLNLQRLGYEVLEAGDGEEGLNIAEDEKPDLIISVLMMPRMDGLKFVQLLKANEDLRYIPIIMLSAVDKQEKVLEAIKAGASDYIIKPYETTELIKKINKYIK